MKVFFKLTHLEIKKMICKKYIVVIILCFTAALGCHMFTYYNVNRSEWQGEIKLYKNIEGMLTEEKYNFLLNELNTVQQYAPDKDTGEISKEAGAKDKGKYMPTRVGDAIVIQSAINQCDFVFTNEQNRQIIMEHAKENMDEYLEETENHKRYLYAFNQKVIKTYSSQPQVYIMNPQIKLMWYVCLAFNIHSPMIILFLILVITSVFVQEKETGMQNLIDTYKKGKEKLFFSKIAAVCTISFLTAVYFECLQLLFFKLLIPEFKGAEYPIQTILPMCPFNITIGDFIVIKIACVSLASILIGMVIALFSVTFSKRLVCIGMSALFSIVTYGVVFYQKIWVTEIMRDGILDHIKEAFSGLKSYMFTYLFYPLDYFEKFECVNIFHHPFFPLTVIISITLIVICMIILLSYFMYIKPKKKLS